MWDQLLVYDFAKGAWVTFRELGKRMGKVKLELPREFPLWRENGEYDVAGLAEYFHGQALEVAGRFDARNGTRWYKKDLEAAGRMPRTMPG